MQITSGLSSATTSGTLVLQVRAIFSFFGTHLVHLYLIYNKPFVAFRPLTRGRTAYLVR